MKKLSPILLIWLAVVLSVLTLLARLQIFLEDYGSFFSIASAMAFLTAASWCWILFRQVSLRIHAMIDQWDSDMQKDIPVFLRTRKFRLMTLFGLMVLLYTLQYVMLQSSDNQQILEMVQYVLIIGLFHCSLVTTLVMFKVFRALSWIEHENHMAKMEKA